MRPWTLRAVLLFSVAAGCLGCHEVGDVRVLSLSFEGVHAFDDGELRRVLATRPSGWLPWAQKQYFDRKEFDADMKRVLAFYADRGFPTARLRGVEVDFNEAKDGVRLLIQVEEGEPVLVEEVRVEGFGDLPVRLRPGSSSLALRAGMRRDRDVVRTARDEATLLFRNHGYPLAVVDASERPGADPRQVIVTYRADPGPAMTFGAATIAGLEKLDDSIVRRELAFTPGQRYDERLVARSQRRLASLELLEVAVVTPRVDAPEGSVVPVRVTVAEGKQHRLKLGAGYGAEDRARGTIAWQHLNFMGGAKQVTFDGKWSFVDRGLRISLTAPYVKRPGLSLTFSASRWISNQLTYDSKTYGGRVTLGYEISGARRGRRDPVRYRFRAGLANEYLRYGIRPEALDDQSRREERLALGLDPDTGRARGTLAAIELDAERVALDNAANPRFGTVTTAHFEIASPDFGGTYRFNEVGGEARVFLPAGRLVFATRARASALMSKDPRTVPFSKRYFLGGSTSLRGWGRFQVSPLDLDGLPIGGFSVIDLSTEARVPLRGRLGAVVFLDAGRVWSDPLALAPSGLRTAAGAGVRFQTPVGVLRVDAGRQLTPIDGLVVNGVPAQRRWRLHFGLGHAF